MGITMPLDEGWGGGQLGSQNVGIAMPLDARELYTDTQVYSTAKG